MKKSKDSLKIVSYYTKNNPLLFDSLNKQRSYKRLFNKEEKEILKIIPSKAEVLEIGAGSGRIIDLLDNGKRKITGIDIADTSSIEKKYKDNPNVKIIKMSADDLKFKDNSFDVCTIMSNTFGLFKNPVKILKDCKKITKKGGMIILSLYESDSNYILKERMKYFRSMGYEPVVVNNQIKLKRGVCTHYFNTFELNQIFGKAGLKFTHHPLTKLGCLWIANIS